MKCLRDLHTLLGDNPPITAALGFHPYQPPPSLERFSAFLCDCPHHVLQKMRVQLTGALIQEGVITGQHVGLDSCPIASAVRENNLKTALRRRRYDKTTPPEGDPDARLGVRIHYPTPGKSQVEYFWGYRNHVLADLESELPLWEITEPNSVGETTVAIPLMNAARKTFKLQFLSVSGDAEYKEHHNRRTAIERVFIRLLAITIQEPSVRGLTSIRNHCTISHIAVLLVALAAHKLGHDDRIRFVRTLVPDFLR